MTSNNSATRPSEGRLSAARAWLRIDTRGRAVTFLSACGLAGLLVLLASGDTTWRLYGLLPDSALNSDRIRVVHDIAADWKAAPPDVLMLGGSQLRELLPEDEFIEAALTADCGRSIHVFNAATSSQPLQSSWAVADLLLRPGQLVVVNLNIWRDVQGQKLERFARTLLPLPDARSMPDGLEQMPLPAESRRRSRLGILFTDTVIALGLRGGPIERVGPFASFQHGYRDVPRRAELKMIDSRFQAGQLRPVAEHAFERNARDFAALARHLRARQATAVFLLTPSSQEIREVMSEFREPEKRAIALLVDVAPLLDLRDVPSLTHEDFADTLHLTAHGRMQVWPDLHAFLRSSLPDCALDKP